MVFKVSLTKLEKTLETNSEGTKSCKYTTASFKVAVGVSPANYAACFGASRKAFLVVSHHPDTLVPAAMVSAGPSTILERSKAPRSKALGFGVVS